MRTWKDVATLVKTKSLNGRFVAHPAAGLPLLIGEGTEVAFVPPQTDCPRSGKVNYLRELSDGTFEVGFDSVTEAACAHALVGCHCLVRRSVLDEVDFEEVPALWTGWRVVSCDGSLIGEVDSLIENPGQSLLEVKRGDGLKPVYVPVVDAFITEVDSENQTVTVDIPEGLLNLND